MNDTFQPPALSQLCFGRGQKTITGVLEAHPTLRQRLSELSTTAEQVATGCVIAHFRIVLNYEDINPCRPSGSLLARLKGNEDTLEVQSRSGVRLVEICPATGRVTIGCLPQTWEEVVMALAALYIASVINTMREFRIEVDGFRYSVSDGRIVIQPA